MRKIIISDATMKQNREDFPLSFKEKIELAKLLDKLGVDFIELEGIKDARTDSLLIKSIASAVTDSQIAVPVELLNNENIEKTWAAIKGATAPRLQVCAPTSSVQIEYLTHKKPDAMLDAIKKTVETCRALCPDVEFVAEDATRSESSFLNDAINTAISAGAKTVTLSDSAGTMLPTEFAEFIRRQYELTPALRQVNLGICCKNSIFLADASMIMAIREGINQIRVAAHTSAEASLSNIVSILAAKEDVLSVSCRVKITQIGRITSQIQRLCNTGKSSKINVLEQEENDGVFLTNHDSLEAVTAATAKLGYDLSDEDAQKVYAAFKQIADRKERVSFKELDAIVASSAMQVPSTYRLDTYVITSGNTISATAHIKLIKNGISTEGVYIGDGSIDAAFQAIEKITGCHYELDDFQLQAVTEGREAMGQTVVKLRAGGKVYSGSGISTDIVGAGIQAYLSALNKIVYEEEAE